MNRADPMHKLFRDLRATMRDIERLEEKAKVEDAYDLSLLRRDGESKEDHEQRLREARGGKRRVIPQEEGESKADYMRRRQRESRRKLLSDRVNPSRKCVLCGATKLKSRSWVIVKTKHLLRVAALVNARRVSLDAYVALKRAGACCLTCWRTKFVGAPRASMPEDVCSLGCVLPQREALIDIGEKATRRRSCARERKRSVTGVGANVDVSREAAGEEV